MNLLVSAAVFWSAAGRTAVVLGAVAAGLAWLSKKVAAQRGSAPRSVRLSPQHAVHVVELEGRRLLVGTGPATAPAVLAELDPVPPDRSPPADGS